MAAPTRLQSNILGCFHFSVRVHSHYPKPGMTSRKPPACHSLPLYLWQLYFLHLGYMKNHLRNWSQASLTLSLPNYPECLLLSWLICSPENSTAKQPVKMLGESEYSDTSIQNCSVLHKVPHMWAKMKDFRPVTSPLWMSAWSEEHSEYTHFKNYLIPWWTASRSSDKIHHRTFMY